MKLGAQQPDSAKRRVASFAKLTPAQLLRPVVVMCKHSQKARRKTRLTIKAETSTHL